MIKKAAVIFGGLAVATVSAQLSGAVPNVSLVTPAFAQQQIDFKHTINLAGGQRMLSQRMSKELLLVAMGYNTRENLRNLRSSFERFERVLKGLHYGDAELALTSSDYPEVVENLSRVEEIWPLFNAALQDSIAVGKVSRDSVSLVSDLSLPLLSAMNDTVIAYEHQASEGALFSMLEIAIDVGARGRMLSQKMTKEFLLIAYGESPEVNRERLAESMALFEKSLGGLMAGDSELQLIPAPLPRIQAQLKSVERLWKEFRPMMQGAVEGKEIDEDTLADVASLNLSLLTEMNSAVNMYEAL